MWVKRVTQLATTRPIQFHACNSSGIETRTKMVLVQASMYQNEIKRLLKPSKKCSYEAKRELGW